MYASISEVEEGLANMKALGACSSRGLDTSHSSSGANLDNIPLHILLDLVVNFEMLSARDLASLECVCYAFRKPTDLHPCRLKSPMELAAHQRCHQHPLFATLSLNKQREVLKRCESSWKRVLHFLLCLASPAAGPVHLLPKQVSACAGNYSTVVIDRQGRLFTFGEHWHERVAAGAPTATLSQEGLVGSRSPRLMTLPDGAKPAQVSANYHHAAVIGTRGELFVFGRNTGGCLGLDTPSDATSLEKPVRVAGLESVCCVQVSAGMKHTVVLDVEGNVYTFGLGEGGRLGHGAEADERQPRLVEALRKEGPMMWVSAGAAHTLVVSRTGVVYAFGGGTHGRLGLGDAQGRNEPTPISSFTDAGLFIVAAVAGDEHSVAIDSAGRVYVWGNGYCGALGNSCEDIVLRPVLVSDVERYRIVQVAARRRKTFFVTDTGKVIVTGWKAGSSLGVPPDTRGIPDPSGEPGVALARVEKILRPVPCLALREHHIVQVSTGWYHSVAVTREGMVLAFGDNERGQLGLRHRIDSQVNDAAEVELY